MRAAASWRRPARIAAELGALFVALILLDRLFAGGTAFAAVAPNPLWVPVIAMALAYGTGTGVVAAALASAYWIRFAPLPHDGDRLDWLFRLSLPPLLWFVAAGIIGEVTLARARRVAWLRRRSTAADRNLARLSEAIERLARTNRALQVRIVGDGATTGHIVATAARLASTDLAARRGAIGELVACSTGTDDFTCYLNAADGGARAWLRGAAVDPRPDALPNTLVAIRRKRSGILHVGRRADRVPLESLGVAAVPLTAHGEMIGALVLHSLPFERLDAHGLATLTEIGGWLALLLAEAPRGLQRGSNVGLVA